MPIQPPVQVPPARSFFYAPPIAPSTRNNPLHEGAMFASSEPFYPPRPSPPNNA